MTGSRASSTLGRASRSTCATSCAPTYLGDGVYASFDGYQIALHVGSHEREPAAFVDPDVLRGLVSYALHARIVTPYTLRTLADLHEGKR